MATLSKAEAKKARAGRHAVHVLATFCVGLAVTLVGLTLADRLSLERDACRAEVSAVRAQLVTEIEAHGVLGDEHSLLMDEFDSYERVNAGWEANYDELFDSVCGAHPTPLERLLLDECYEMLQDCTWDHERGCDNQFRCMLCAKDETP